MKRLIFLVSALVAVFSLLIYNYSSASLLPLLSIFPVSITSSASPHTHLDNHSHTALHNISESMLKAAMAKTLQHAKIIPHRSATRGHSDHGWLNTYHSFSFADWYDPRFTSFGALRVLNEDRVKAQSGFPTHPHRDFEIFSYILSGELTHRDSMLRKGAEGGSNVSPDQFYRMRRGDVQFTTGGTGIAHSEMNEHRADTVHFLQIWAVPWKRGLAPRYHTRHFAEADKRSGFVVILSPLAAGPEASKQDEEAAQPVLEGSIPIHADFVMGAGILAPQGGDKAVFEWKVGADARFVDEDGEKRQASKRKVFVHLPMTKGGKSKVKIDGRDDAVLSEGDGAFIDAVNAGDRLVVENVGSVEAEVIVLDSRA